MIFLIVEYAATGGNLENLPDSAINMNFQIFIFMSLAVGGVGLLVSEDLRQRLPLGPGFKTQPMGQSELRGKAKKMSLHTILLAHW